MDRDPTARRLVIGVCVLLLVDVVGGLLAIANDVNSAGEAWSGQASLAAPLPMMVAQAVLTFVAVRWRGTPGVVAAGLLALACLVSGISGFFDGQLFKDELAGWLVAFQVLLVSTTLVVGGLAVHRTVHLLRTRVRSPQADAEV
jgi:hypothetical protein